MKFVPARNPNTFKYFCSGKHQMIGLEPDVCQECNGSPSVRHMYVERNDVQGVTICAICMESYMNLIGLMNVIGVE